MDKPETATPTIDELLGQAEEITARLEALHHQLGDIAISAITGRTERQELLLAAGDVAALAQHFRQALELLGAFPAPPGRTASKEAIQLAELYSKLVDPRRFGYPQPRCQNQEQPLQVTIADDCHIMVDGQIIPLEGDALFLFNRLVVRPGVMQDAHMLSQGLQTLPFERDDVQRKRVLQVMRYLMALAGPKVVQRVRYGRGNAYKLAPNVELLDLRTANELAALVAAAETDMATEVCQPAEEPTSAPTPQPVPKPDPVPPRPRTEVHLLDAPIRVRPVSQPQPPDVPEFGYSWGDTAEIAQLAGLDETAARAFVSHHRSKLGTVFLPPRMISKPLGEHTRVTSEHYSPQFVEWAVASLKAAKAKVEGERHTKPSVRGRRAATRGS